MGEHVEIRVRVTGHVQGVWYRAWTRQEAEHLGVAGWVRNEPDGSVAAHLAGPPERVERLVDAMRHGPPGAHVAGIAREPVDPPEHPVGFTVAR